jgi:hypothetical protein
MDERARLYDGILFFSSSNTHSTQLPELTFTYTALQSPQVPLPAGLVQQDFSDADREAAIANLRIAADKRYSFRAIKMRGEICARNKSISRYHYCNVL